MAGEIYADANCAHCEGRGTASPDMELGEIDVEDHCRCVLDQVMSKSGWMAIADGLIEVLPDTSPEPVPEEEVTAPVAPRGALRR